MLRALPRPTTPVPTRAHCPMPRDGQFNGLFCARSLWPYARHRWHGPIIAASRSRNCCCWMRLANGCQAARRRAAAAAMRLTAWETMALQTQSWICSDEVNCLQPHIGFCIMHKKIHKEIRIPQSACANIMCIHHARLHRIT